jgi:hypothetical protein
MQKQAQENLMVDDYAGKFSADFGVGAERPRGGAVRLLAGMVMVGAGSWLLTTQVTVQSSFWLFRGHSMFGLTLLPFLFGIAILFFNGRSRSGILLTLLGLLLMFLGVLDSREIYFRPASLLRTLVMFSLLAGGIGLIVRTLMAPDVAPDVDRGNPFNE